MNGSRLSFISTTADQFKAQLLEIKTLEVYLLCSDWESTPYQTRSEVLIASSTDRASHCKSCGILQVMTNSVELCLFLGPVNCIVRPNPSFVTLGVQLVAVCEGVHRYTSHRIQGHCATSGSVSDCTADGNGYPD